MKEIRNFTNLEVRLLDDSTNPDVKSKTIRGTAIVYNKTSEVMSDYFTSFREIIEPKAFGDISTQDIRALWSHDTSKILGRTKNKSLRLNETDDGIEFELDLPETQTGLEVYELIKRGDIDSMSFGFKVLLDDFESTSDGQSVIRRIRSATLYEVSPVAWPAYTQTEVEARTLDKIKEIKTNKVNKNLNIEKHKLLLATL